MASLSRYLDPVVVQQVARLDLRARFIVEGFLAGLHRSPYQGLSVDFSEHRKYTPGDEPRSIDWNVFARTDRLFVRKYQAETHLACHLLVDASASMGFVGAVGSEAFPTPQPPAKLLYAIHIAAALAYLVTRQKDAIGLGVIGERLQAFLPARARQQQLAAILGTLTALAPRGKTGVAAAIAEALSHIPHRGLIVVMSDLLTDPAACLEALHRVRFRGHDLIVMHILDAAETRLPFDGAVRLEDPESGDYYEADADAVRAAYAGAVERWRDELAGSLRAARADYVALDTSIPFDRALIEFLLQRSRRA